MEPTTIGIITIGLLLVAILMGVHVGIALGTLSFVGVWWIKGNFIIALKLLGLTSFSAISDYLFGILPLFILMGLFSAESGISVDLYNSAYMLLSRIRGGLAMATVLANAIFAAITGVSVASAAVFSKISLPQMERLGYDKRFSLGTVGGSSVLGMLIPPSVLLIIYGILSEQSVGKLFIAGVIPGGVLTLVYSAGIYLMVTLKPDLAGKGEGAVFPEGTNRWVILLKPWPMILLVVLVLGGIYGGLFTPTEAGAVGAFGAMILGLASRKLTKQKFWRALMETGYTTGSIFFLLITASMYSRMLALSGITFDFGDYVASLSVSPPLVILIFLGVFLLLGTILDSTSILLVSIPLMLPVVDALGYDLIWFGILSIVAIEMGLLTPPFGMVVFTMKASLGESATLEEIFMGCFPFLLMMLLVLIILFMFPILVTWLPSMM